MVRTEERKITETIGRGILSLNLDFLKEVGLDTGKKYTVIYDENKIIVTNKKLKSVTID